MYSSNYYNNPFNSQTLECFLSCPRGLEEITKDDIEVYCSSSHIDKGGVAFSGDMRSLYSVNLHSRTGMHALIKLLEIKVTNNEQLYKGILEYQWYEWITPEDTIMIRGRARSKYFENAQYASLKVKDAIVDCLRKKTGRRPSIDKNNPRYSLYLLILEDKVSIYLNSSGNALSKRGYREKVHKASLNEALAAGIIMLSGWTKDKPFYDPLCGSGTFPIEAILIGKNIPAGYYRKSFAFQKWHQFNSKLWNQIVIKAKDNFKHDRLHIYGSDHLAVNIRLCHKNTRKILIHNHVKFKIANLSEFNPDNEGVIIMNPPYGERIGKESELELFYQLIGDVLKTNCKESDAFILSGNANLDKYIGLKPKQKFFLKNGRIDCRLLHYPICTGVYAD